MTTCSIVCDPLEYDYLTSTQYDPGTHQIIPDGEWLRQVKARFDRQTLFLFRHSYTGVVVLADWTIPPSYTDCPMFMEICAMADHPDSSPHDRPAFEYLQFRFLPVRLHAERVAKQFREQKKQKDDERVNEAIAKQDAIKLLRKRGLYFEADQLARGATPWVSPTGENAEKVKEMYDMMQVGNKVYSDGGAKNERRH